MSIYAADKRQPLQPSRSRDSSGSWTASPVFPVDAGHERTLSALTLDLLNGQPADVLAATDRLIGAMRESERRSDVRDLLILRRLAELDLSSGTPGVLAPATETALHFALRIVPLLDRAVPIGSMPPRPVDHPIPPSPVLTPREIEIVELTARGLSNQEIAWQLWISEGTVKKHQSNLFRKLGVRNRTGAVARARDFGILS